MDWTNQERFDIVRAYAIQPTNLDYTRYEMGGLVLSGSSISGTYYGDTRASGKIALSDANGDRGWDRNSFVRLVHEVPSAGYKRELGTFLVSDDGGSLTGGENKRSLTLQSMLYALKNDVVRRTFIVKRGASWLIAIRQLLDGASRPYVMSASEKRCGADTTFETGKSKLDVLLAMCSAAGYRADVDAHGRIVIKDYRLPVQREGSFTLDMTARDGIVHDGLGYTSDWVSRPNIAIANMTWSDTVNKQTINHEIVGTAEITSGYNAAAVRGYSVGTFKSIGDNKALRSQAFVDSQARAMLSSDQWEDTEFTVSTQYLPIWEGDVGTLVLPEGARVFDSVYSVYTGQVRVLVKSCDLSLDTMQLKLTLKIVNAKDTEGSD